MGWNYTPDPWSAMQFSPTPQQQQQPPPVDEIDKIIRGMKKLRRAAAKEETKDKKKQKPPEKKEGGTKSWTFGYQYALMLMLSPIIGPLYFWSVATVFKHSLEMIQILFK